MRPADDGMLSNTRLTCPAIKSASAGPSPLQGTCSICVPVRCSNSSPLMWLSPPLPEDPNAYLPGWALSACTSPCRSVAGKPGLMTSTLVGLSPAVAGGPECIPAGMGFECLHQSLQIRGWKTRVDDEHVGHIGNIADRREVLDGVVGHLGVDVRVHRMRAFHHHHQCVAISRLPGCVCRAHRPTGAGP